MSSNDKIGVSIGSMKICQGKDVLERMNYLYQASHLMAVRSKNPVAASCYGNIMVACAKKAVLRINPAIKRTICKCCQMPLVPGGTARVRLVSKPTKMVKWTCLICNGTKRFPTKKGYRLWADQPDALVEFFDYTPKSKVSDSARDRSEKVEELVEPTKSSNRINSENNREINSCEKECNSYFEDLNILG